MRGLWPLALCLTLGCMQLQSASLGAEEQVVPALDEPTSDGSLARASDASLPRANDARAVPLEPRHDDEEGEREHEADDVRTLVDAEVQIADAGTNQASRDAQLAQVDAAPLDAATVDVAPDAAPEDAAPALNPICRIEPWHCL